MLLIWTTVRTVLPRSSLECFCCQHEQQLGLGIITVQPAGKKIQHVAVRFANHKWFAALRVQFIVSVADTSDGNPVLAVIWQWNKHHRHSWRTVDEKSEDVFRMQLAEFPAQANTMHYVKRYKQYHCSMVSESINESGWDGTIRRQLSVLSAKPADTFPAVGITILAITKLYHLATATRA